MGRLTTTGKAVLGVAALGAAVGVGIVANQSDKPATGGAAQGTDCPYCCYFDDRTRMQMWTVNVTGTCERNWWGCTDTNGTPCVQAIATPTRTVTPAPTLPPGASPTPGRTPTPPPTLRPPTATPRPTAIPPGAWSLTLPAQGYRVVIECAPGACWIDGQTSAWVLTGPWVMRMEPVQ